MSADRQGGMSRGPTFVDLDPDLRERLANGLDYDSWDELPDAVKRNLRARDTDLEPVLNGNVK